MYLVKGKNANQMKINNFLLTSTKQQLHQIYFS